MPAVATIAATRSRSRSSRAASPAEIASPEARPRSSASTSSTSASITRAADRTEEWAPVEVTMSGRTAARSGAAERQTWRATTSAERFAAEPPETKTPPAEAGSPARSDSQRSASFSAKTAPDDSSHVPPNMPPAPTTRSNRVAASVGADGTKERNRGWSMEMHAGASTSLKTRNASSPPMPSGVTVCPAIARSSASVRGWSSGGGSSRIRSTA